MPRSAVGGGLAAAGLRLLLREAAGGGTVEQHRGLSARLSGAAAPSDEQHQEQSPGAHRPAGGTRCPHVVSGLGAVSDTGSGGGLHAVTSPKGSWSNVEQAMLKVSEGLDCISTPSLRMKLEEDLLLVKG